MATGIPTTAHLEPVPSQSSSPKSTNSGSAANDGEQPPSPQTRVDSVWQSLRNRPSVTDKTESETDRDKKLFAGQQLTTRTEIFAWYLVDWANSPMWNVILAFVMPLYLTQMATNYACSHGAENGCDIDGELIGSSDTLSVDIGLFSVKPISFAFTMVAISGVVQLFSYLFIGALADYSFYSFYLPHNRII